MDDQALGLALRRIRIRRGLRQSDLAETSGVSATTISLIERGHVDHLALSRVRAVAAALDARIESTVRWRGGDLDRLVASRHAALAEAVAGVLVSEGWTVIPEFSFNHFGERGVVDIVAWHGGERMLLIVEIKTELVDVHDLLATMDRRRRVVPLVISSRGWDPRAVSMMVVLGESRTNRRRVAAHATLLRTAFPHDGRQVRPWLARPTGPIQALWFLPDSRATGAGRGTRPVKRVAGRRSSTGPVG